MIQNIFFERYRLQLTLMLFLVLTVTSQLSAGQGYEKWVATDTVIENMVARFIQNTPTVGLSIGFVQGEIRRVYHFGEIEKGTGQLPTDTTLYAIGSISKTFAGALLAQAITEGKVQLEDDIRKYLVGDYPNLEYNGEAIRLVHLLDHNSGLPLMLPTIKNRNKTAVISETQRTLNERQTLSTYTREDFLEDLHHIKLTSKPGQKFQYSNAATRLLGYILERIYSKPYEELVKIRITTPLAMTDTKFTLSKTETRVFKGHNAEGVAVPNNSDYMPAAGGMKASLPDMLKYMQWHLSEKNEAIKRLHTPTWNLTENYWIGMGWQMFQFPTFRMIWQEGSLPGYTSYCVIYPEFNLGIVALMNVYDPKTSSEFSALVKALASALDPRIVDLP